MTDFVRKALVLAAIALGLLAVWRLRVPELVLFGAILFAIVLRAAARGVTRWTRIRGGWALALATVAIAVGLLGFLVFFGLRLESQTEELVRLLPPQWAQFRRSLQSSPLGRGLNTVIDELTSAPSAQWMADVRSYATGIGLGVVDALLMVAAGIYLAAQPDIYIKGVLRLIPASQRDKARHVLHECGALLGRWIGAQAAAMATIGLLSGLGLWAVGEPAAAALGVFAGLAEAVPVIGPIIAAVPALLMALTGGWPRVLATLALYVAIHQFESNVLQPMLQRGFTSIPPVLNLFALAVFWLFFGVLGIIFAAPLTVVCIVVVRILYLHDDADFSAAPPPVWVRWLLGRWRA